MRYFKRKDGSVFGKVNWIKKKVVSEILSNQHQKKVVCQEMTFDFKCHRCSNIWEQIILGDEKPKCTKCRSTRARKLMSAPIVHMNTINDNDLRKENIIS